MEKGLTMTDQTPAVLSYASAPVDRVPWGPVWFWPSRRSVVLAVLTIGAFMWLARRHEPWTHVRSFATDEVNTPGFTADGLLLTFDGARGANLWDPKTGQHLRTVVPRLTPGDEAAYAMDGGRRVLVLGEDGEPGLIYDARPPPAAPRPPVTVPNPIGWRADLHQACPGGPYVITRASTLAGRWFQPYGSRTLYLWSLREGAKTLTADDMRLLPFPAVAKFSPDGSLILQWRDWPAAGFVLLEARTLREVAKADYPDVRIRDAGFAPAGGRNVFCVVTQRRSLPAGQAATDEIEVRSCETGGILHRFSVPAAPNAGFGQTRYYNISGGGKTLALVGRPQASGAWMDSIEFWEVSTGRTIAVRNSGFPHWNFRFTGPDDRYVDFDPSALGLAVYQPRYAHPVAYLPADESPRWGNAIYSSHGRYLVCIGMRPNKGPGRDTYGVTLFRKTGWDCPESPVGMLAMPPAWAVAATFVALCVSLHHDARRRAVSRTPRLLLPLSLLILLAALPRAVHFLLVGSVQQRLLLTPAVIVVICAIGLGTWSRFWRVVMMAALAGQVSLNLICVHALKKAGMMSFSKVDVLDRNWEIPHLPVLMALVMASVLIPVLMYRLAARAQAQE